MMWCFGTGKTEPITAWVDRENHFGSFTSEQRKTKCITNKTFWKELSAYSPTGPHGKQRLQQFFVAAGTCLPSRCLATIEGIHTETHKVMGRNYDVRC
jgi:hypothetical protein